MALLEDEELNTFNYIDSQEKLFDNFKRLCYTYDIKPREQV